MLSAPRTRRSRAAATPSCHVCRHEPGHLGSPPRRLPVGPRPRRTPVGPPRRGDIVFADPLQGPGHGGIFIQDAASSSSRTSSSRRGGHRDFSDLSRHPGSRSLMGRGTPLLIVAVSASARGGRSRCEQRRGNATAAVATGSSRKQLTAHTPGQARAQAGPRASSTLSPRSELAPAVPARLASARASSPSYRAPPFRADARGVLELRCARPAVPRADHFADALSPARAVRIGAGAAGSPSASVAEALAMDHGHSSGASSGGGPVT